MKCTIRHSTCTTALSPVRAECLITPLPHQLQDRAFNLLVARRGIMQLECSYLSWLTHTSSGCYPYRLTILQCLDHQLRVHHHMLSVHSVDMLASLGLNLVN